MQLTNIARAVNTLYSLPSNWKYCQEEATVLCPCRKKRVTVPAAVTGSFYCRRIVTLKCTATLRNSWNRPATEAPYTGHALTQFWSNRRFCFVIDVSVHRAEWRHNMTGSDERFLRCCDLFLYEYDLINIKNMKTILKVKRMNSCGFALMQ